MLVKRKVILFWMIIGLFMIFFQIIIGGVTRLTGSGLSITKWEIVTGTIPPLSEAAWDEAYRLYQETPQYHKINKGMSLSDFKFIYFWEYLHRLWARMMGLVFLFPFLFFLWKGWLDKRIIRRLIILVFLAALVGLLGWIMVASGLIERPWVNAYKLSIHLCMALVVYAYLLWTLLLSRFGYTTVDKVKNRGIISIFTGLLFLQLFLGGMMSGMKAALLYPSWPMLNGQWIPTTLRLGENWHVSNFVNYDSGPFLISLVQVLHRNLAYILFFMSLYILFSSINGSKNINIRRFAWMLVIVLVIQMVFGITILLQSKGAIPVLYGVLHQAVAIVLLTLSIILYYFHKYKVETAN